MELIKKLQGSFWIGVRAKEKDSQILFKVTVKSRRLNPSKSGQGSVLSPGPLARSLGGEGGRASW